MSAPLIPGKIVPVTASNVLEAIADAVLAIKMEDRLTWSAMGNVFGKSEDQAAKYADGSAEMGAVAIAFAWEKWNGRFIGRLAQLVQSNRKPIEAQQTQSCLLAAAYALAVALEDGELSEDDIRANRKTLEVARDAIDGQLARLKPREAA